MDGGSTSGDQWQCDVFHQQLSPLTQNWKVRGSNPTSATRLPLSRLGQPGSILALVLPSGGMAVRHRKGATAERFLSFRKCAIF
ncbi:hypothetical protein T265_09321 [Opisthorchis viverrini]|uniref:Uncharacterized protein n=1 Tax=Opisthorchis viverrini TaxID=6198 RepID=A0A074ZHC2_OPIVI|nr:hypothetical protein T265_09321 [Opisthorchis viverrini]KER22615.1 hypothetical protein T265_09321 [Opisthorchis viverrini]